MTIRDFLTRRTRMILAVGFCGWLVLPLSAIFAEDHGPALVLVPFAFLLFGGAIVTYLFVIRCPRCKVRFGNVAGEMAFHWGTRARVNFCPYCGVSLDEPCEGPTRIR